MKCAFKLAGSDPNDRLLLVKGLEIGSGSRLGSIVTPPLNRFSLTPSLFASQLPKAGRVLSGSGRKQLTI